MRNKIIYVAGLMLASLFIACEDEPLKNEENLFPQIPDEEGDVLPPNEHWGWVGKYPGEVALGLERIQNQEVAIIGDYETSKFNILGNNHYWQSSGLYVPPAEAIIVEVPEGVSQLYYQIGVANVEIPNEGVLFQRYYKVDKEGVLKAGRNTIYNNFGGHLYFFYRPMVEERISKAKGTNIQVKVSGCVASSDYKLNVTDIAQWRETVTDSVSPMIWGELIGEKVALTLPVENLKKIEYPHTLVKFYDEIIETLQQWSGLDHKNVEGIPSVRIYSDIQLPLDPNTEKKAYSTVSGYPMAVNRTHADSLINEVINLTSLNSDNARHIIDMIGKGFMSDWRNSDYIATIAPQLSTYYLKNQKGEWPNNCPNLTKKPDLMTGDNLKRYPDLSNEMKVRMLIQLAQEYGWGIYTYINKRANEVVVDSLPAQSKTDIFAIMASEYAGVNLISFFDAWRLPLTAYARERMGLLPTNGNEFWETFKTSIPALDQGGNPQAIDLGDIPVIDTIYNRLEWSGVASSTNSGKSVTYLLDGNVNTNWHNQWSQSADKIYPHWVSFTFDKEEVPKHELEFNYVDIYLLPTDRRDFVTPKTCQFQYLNQDGDWIDIDEGKYYFVVNRAGRQRFFLESTIVSRGIKFIMLTPHSKEDFEFGAGGDCTFTEFSVGLIK